MKTLLDLLVDELDESVVLLAQLLLQDPVVLLADLLSPLLAHPLADQRHLLERKHWLVPGAHPGPD